MGVPSTPVEKRMKMSAASRPPFMSQPFWRLAARMACFASSFRVGAAGPSPRPLSPWHSPHLAFWSTCRPGAAPRGPPPPPPPAVPPPALGLLVARPAPGEQLRRSRGPAPRAHHGARLLERGAERLARCDYCYVLVGPA